MMTTNILTEFPNLELVAPNPKRDASFAYGWFNSATGKDTLLRMGNAEGEILESSLAGEEKILAEFIQLEEQGRQITRIMVYKGITIGAVWIELQDTKHVKALALHIMIGDPMYRGMGIGMAVMMAMIKYAQSELQATTIYSRHLVSNSVITRVFERLGFDDDGEPYVEENGLTFQNVILKNI